MFDFSLARIAPKKSIVGAMLICETAIGKKGSYTLDSLEKMTCELHGAL
jgi:hypothetical protein